MKNFIEGDGSFLTDNYKGTEKSGISYHDGKLSQNLCQQLYLVFVLRTPHMERKFSAKVLNVFVFVTFYLAICRQLTHLVSQIFITVIRWRDISNRMPFIYFLFTSSLTHPTGVKRKQRLKFLSE